MAKRVEQFWNRVEKGTTCWNWTGSKRGGYGRIREDGRYVQASRFAYELAYGAFDKTLDVLHRCDNPSCVRPDHLVLGTHRDNMQDMLKKGRGNKLSGELHAMAKLTAQKVKEIRALLFVGCPARTIAGFYGVSRHMIYRIKNNQNWKAA